MISTQILNIYIYLLVFTIIIVLYGSYYFINLYSNSDFYKFYFSWYAILMIANIINMIVTIKHYRDNRLKIGPKGVKGDNGPKGYRGDQDMCGAICNSAGIQQCTEEEKNKNGGKCPPIISSYTDDNGTNITNDPKLKPGKCIFPFIYNYSKQYQCVDENSPDFIKDDPNVPKNANKNGWCATSLNSNGTAKTYGYCDKSGRLEKLQQYKLARDKLHEERINTQSGILDLKIITGNRSSIKCPNGYTKINKDLNEGSTGAYVYLCKKTGIASKGISAIGISENGENCNNIINTTNTNNSMKIKTLDTNLNKDTSLDDTPPRLNMCLGISNKNYIKDLYVSNFSNLQDDIDFDKQKYDIKNYSLIDTNLNKGTTGTDLYIHTTNIATNINPVNTAFVYERTLYFIEGSKLYEFSKVNNKVNAGIELKTKFGDLPNNLDACFTYKNNTYFFAGSYIYLYNKNTQDIEKGFPKPINNIFKGIPNNIDAVFTWDKDNVTYFFKDKYYYKFNDRTQKVATGFPKLISARWPGAPDNIDAIFNYNNNTYFLRGDKYYLIGDNETIIESNKIDTKFNNLSASIAS